MKASNYKPLNQGAPGRPATHKALVPTKHPQKTMNLQNTAISQTLVLAATLLWFNQSANATILYATGGNSVYKVNTSLITYTSYFTASAAVDSLAFDLTGNLIYTEHTAGQIRQHSSGGSDTLIAAVPGTTPADIVLEPGGNKILVSEYASGKIERVDLTSGVHGTLLSGGVNPEGLAYDGSRLFANLGNRYGGPAGKYVAEIDPNTGIILGTTPGLDSLDGLTYDPYSGMLFACSLFGNKVYEIDPNNLNNYSDITLRLGGTIRGPDGIAADGLGNIWIASSSALGDSHIYQLDLIANTITQNAYVPGLDDVAVVPTPEPSTFALIGLGLACFLRLRKEKNY
jgi:streptogramin lyase